MGSRALRHSPGSAFGLLVIICRALGKIYTIIINSSRADPIFIQSIILSLQVVGLSLCGARLGDYDEKSPEGSGLINRQRLRQILPIPHCAQNMEQMDKQVENVQIEANRHHDVVGVRVMNHPAGIVEDESTHQHDNYSGYCQ